ncbi:MAG: CatA-like O-acetyltransferase, family 2 [Anaerovoracaceae bacterium]
MREIEPEKTKRAEAYELWIDAPMPMITIFKTLDVTNLIKLSRRYGYKFTMLMCWCIGKVSAQTEEFYLLPVGRKMVQYDKIAVNTVVLTSDGGINTCDIPFSESIEHFNKDYMKLTRMVSYKCKPYNLGEDYMVVGTSSLAKYDIDGAVNIYAGIYNNPFFIWGRYRKRFLKTNLKLSFQFHHTQMDGIPAAEFLERLQREICELKF